MKTRRTPTIRRMMRGNKLKNPQRMAGTSNNGSPTATNSELQRPTMVVQVSPCCSILGAIRGNFNHGLGPRLNATSALITKERKEKWREKQRARRERLGVRRIRTPRSREILTIFSGRSTTTDVGTSPIDPLFNKLRLTVTPTRLKLLEGNYVSAES